MQKQAGETDDNNDKISAQNPFRCFAVMLLKKLKHKNCLFKVALDMLEQHFFIKRRRVSKRLEKKRHFFAPDANFVSYDILSAHCFSNLVELVFMTQTLQSDNGTLLHTISPFHIVVRAQPSMFNFNA